MGAFVLRNHTSNMETRAARKSVFVVEDSAAVRARLVEWLGGIQDVRVVGEAGTPEDAVTGILKAQPRYVVLDFQLDGGTGADVLRTVRAQMPQTVFIVLTNYPEPQVRRMCMEAGADAFFDKSRELAKTREFIMGARPIVAELHRT
jgi:DNA-binding NarL/FixJ family response regulator